VLHRNVVVHFSYLYLVFPHSINTAPLKPLGIKLIFQIKLKTFNPSHNIWITIIKITVSKMQRISSKYYLFFRNKTCIKGICK